jgi:trehalose-6-phosphate synthase
VRDLHRLGESLSAQDELSWQAMKNINRLFANELVELVKHDVYTITVKDYKFMLLPSYFRDLIN